MGSSFLRPQFSTAGLQIIAWNWSPSLLPPPPTKKKRKERRKILCAKHISASSAQTSFNFKEDTVANWKKKKYRRPAAKFFAARVAKPWNSLPKSMLTTLTLNSFKAKLGNCCSHCIYTTWSPQNGLRTLPTHKQAIPENIAQRR